MPGYNERILIMNTGLNPQIVTLALWALHKEENWVPTSVHLMTTELGEKRLFDMLLKPPLGARRPLDELREAGVALAQDAIKVHVPETDIGEKITMLDTDEEIEASIREYDGLFASYLANEDSEVFCFPKGGIGENETIMALTFLFRKRPQDRWWKLRLRLLNGKDLGLDSPRGEYAYVQKIERDPDFWFPDRDITIRLDQEALTQSGAKSAAQPTELTIRKDQIQVVLKSLKYGGVRNLGEKTPARQASFPNIATAARIDSADFCMLVDLEDRRIWVPEGWSKPASPAHFTALVWFILANVFELRKKPVKGMEEAKQVTALRLAVSRWKEELESKYPTDWLEERSHFWNDVSLTTDAQFITDLEFVLQGSPVFASVVAALDRSERAKINRGESVVVPLDVVEDALQLWICHHYQVTPDDRPAWWQTTQRYRYEVEKRALKPLVVGKNAHDAGERRLQIVSQDPKPFWHEVLREVFQAQVNNTNDPDISSVTTFFTKNYTGNATLEKLMINRNRKLADTDYGLLSMGVRANKVYFHPEQQNRLRHIAESLSGLNTFDGTRLINFQNNLPLWLEPLPPENQKRNAKS